MTADIEEEQENFDDELSKIEDENEKKLLLQELREKALENKYKKEFIQALTLTKKYMQYNSNQKFILLIDFESIKEFKFAAILKELSSPKFILFLNINKEIFINRYKMKNGLDDIEKDELPKVYTIFDNSIKMKEFFISQVKKLDFINFLEFNNIINLRKAKDNLLSLFKKDFIIILNRTSDQNSVQNINSSYNSNHN